MTETTPPSSESGGAHPSIVELSLLLDGELAGRQEAVTGAHLEACPACREEVDRLAFARSAVSSAGLPQPPNGSSDRAVVAALFVTSLSLAAQAARPGVEGAAVPAAEADALRSDQLLAGPGHGGRGGEARPRGEPSRRAADARKSRARAASQGALALLVLGALGAVLAAFLGSGHRSLPSTSPASSTRPAIGASPRQTTTTPPTTAAGPSLGSFSLQLRPELGTGSCRRTSRRIESVGGAVAALNPPAARPAVVATPVGSPSGCVLLAPAFATLWRGDIAHLSIVSPPASSATTTSSLAVGPGVEVVIELAGPMRSSSSLLRAEAAGTPTEVVAQGAGIGTAAVARGEVVTLKVGRSVALFVARQLGLG